MLRLLTRFAAFGTLSLLTVVLAHNLVFVMAYGPAYREVLSRTGHGTPWTTAVLIVLALGLGLALAATVRIGQLTWEARSLAPHPSRLPDGAPFAPGFLWLWCGLAVSGSALFAAQENLEHLAAGAPLPGVGVLTSGGRPDALLVIAVVAAVVAFVGQLFRWRRAVLSARIAVARLRLPRAASAFIRPLEHVGRRPTSILGRRLAVRAPPLA